MSAQIEKIEFKEVEVPIIYEKEEYLPIVSLQLIFKNSGHLSENKEGLAKMSAKLLNEGTKEEGTIEFATSLEEKAISLSASLGRETFVINIDSLKEQFPFALKRLKELLNDPNYTKEALSYIKQKELGWLNKQKSNFNYIASNNLRKVLFKDSPLEKEYYGTEDSIKSLNLEEIEEFIKKHLGYNNLIIVLGGDIELNNIKKPLEDILNILPKTTTTEIEKIEVSNKKETLLIKEDTQQAYIYFGAPFIFNNQKDEYLKQIAEHILGSSGFGSRLMEEIRVKRGLAYSAYCSLRVTKSVNYLSGYLQTKLTSKDEAIKTVKEIINEFTKKGITKEELEETKLFLLGSQPLRKETLSQRLGKAFSNYYENKEQNFNEEQLEKIEKVTLDEVNNFIKNHTEIEDISFSIVTK